MDTQRSFWSALWRQQGPPSRFSRYIAGNGILYFPLGLALYLVPIPWLIRLYVLDESAGEQQGLVRAIGVTVLVIAWFYFMGGRARAESFGLATVVSRLLLPFLLLPLWFLGITHAGLVIAIAILDPALALGGYLIWRSERVA